MSELAKYIEKIKKYKNETPELSEIELIRYVYLDLGSRLSFDEDFYFGNSKSKKEIYMNQNSKNKEALEKCMKQNKAICKSMAYILEYILKAFGININTVVMDEYEKKYPHVYNIIVLSDGRRFAIDIQDDIRNIQSHSRTKSFGIDTQIEGIPLISLKELEQIDRKIGYISDTNYYSDDYMYLLRYYSQMFEKLGEKAEFIFQNLEPNVDLNINHVDRIHRLEDLIEDVFTPEEQRKITIINGYYTVESSKQYEMYIVVDSSGIIDIYKFSKQNNRFEKETLEELAMEVNSGLVLKRGIRDLNKVRKNISKPDNQDR